MAQRRNPGRTGGPTSPPRSARPACPVRARRARRRAPPVRPARGPAPVVGCRPGRGARTSCGWRRVSSWAIIPPIDRPTTTAGAESVARRTSAASSAIARIVRAPGTVRDQPVPRLSTRMTRWSAASGPTNAAGHSRPDAVQPLSSRTVGPTAVLVPPHRGCTRRAGACGVEQPALRQLLAPPPLLDGGRPVQQRAGLRGEATLTGDECLGLDQRFDRRWHERRLRHRVRMAHGQHASRCG